MSKLVQAENLHVGSLESWLDLQLKLVDLERSTDIKDTLNLQKILSVQELVKRGRCLNNLCVSSYRIALGGRYVIDLEKDKACVRYER